MELINVMSMILYLLSVGFIIVKWDKMMNDGINFWKSRIFKYDVWFVSFCLMMAIQQVVIITCDKN